MAALVCDICGGKLIMGSGGIATCDSCGMEHSQDRMKEKIQEIKGTVRVDNTHMIDTYLEMSATALEAGNNEEAENYANKVIEIDSRSAKAWLYKGKAAGWQTTGINNRYPESIVNWINAYSFASDEEKETIIESIKTEAMNISAAILQMECNSFVEYRSEDNKNDVFNALDIIEKQLDLLKEKTEIDVYINIFKTILSRTINTAIINASNNSDREFGPENKNRDEYSWRQFTADQDRCLSLLEKAYELCSDDDLCDTICQNYISIAEEVRDSCSYKWQYSEWNSEGYYVQEYSFTDSAKRDRTNIIDAWKKKKSNHNPEERKKNCKSAITQYLTSCGEASRKLAITQYWENHASEKASLENELLEIKREKEHIQNIASQDSNRMQIAKLNDEISSIQSQINSLGLFKGKEKKSLAMKIDELNNQKSIYEGKWASTKRELDSNEAKLDARVKEINKEFTKDRGIAKITPKQYLKVFSGGHGIISAMDFALYHKNVLPDGFSVKGEGEEIVENYTRTLMLETQSMLAMLASLMGTTSTDETPPAYEDDPETLKMYRVNFMAGSEDSNISANVFGKAVNSSITDIVFYQLNGDKTPKAVANFIQIINSTIIGICPDIEIDGLENEIAEIAYGLSPAKEILTDDILCIISGSTKDDLKFEIKPAIQV